MVVARAGEGRMGNCLLDMEFQFCKMARVLEMDGDVESLHSSMNI